MDVPVVPQGSSTPTVVVSPPIPAVLLAGLPTLDVAPTPLSDSVVFSSAPFRLMAELATEGVRQLATLLPTLERVAADPAVAPSLGHLAKAAGAAARQLGEGHDALLAQGPERIVAALPDRVVPRAPGLGAEPALRLLARSVGVSETAAPAAPVDDGLRAAVRHLGASADAPPMPLRDAAPDDPDPAAQWLREADHLLRRADDALEAAVDRPLSLPAGAPAPDPAAINWAQVEVAAARSTVAATLARLAAHPAAARAGDTRRPTLGRMALPFRGGVGLLGVSLLVGLLLLLAGAWSLLFGLLTLAGTALCAWRIGRASVGVRLDGRA